ncbi:MAG: peroxidase family protein [Planctomycetaceae bacterium]
MDAQGTGGSNPYRVRLTSVRTIDGSNSGAQPNFGATFTPLLRQAFPDYPGDFWGRHDRASRSGNPRSISNLVCAQSSSVVNPLWTTDYLWAWGQFLDHDLDLTEGNSSDPLFEITIDDPTDILGPNPILFQRSQFVNGSFGLPREQINQITAYIDASNVYGSDSYRQSALRAYQGGRLKLSAGRLLPYNTAGLHNAPTSGAEFFLAGDVRANENVVLTSLHTIFVREHNRLANLIRMMDPQATDEQVYQLARKIVGAEMQLITYQEFLPVLLGNKAPTPQHCLPSGVRPDITNEFSTAFFRFGHSALSPDLVRSENGRYVGKIPLRNAFFNVEYIANDPANVDRLLAGLQIQRHQKIDPFIIDDVRNFLFGPPGAGGLDLVSLNLQRGRDHGLPDYNTLREAYGLPRVSSFEQISSDPVVRSNLQAAYGSVDNIDPWLGGLAEDHAPGASVGPLVQAALADQFTRLLAGDNFSHLVDPDLRQPLVQSVVDLNNCSLANVIRRNTELTWLNDDVFEWKSPSRSDVQASFNLAANRLILEGNHASNLVIVVPLLPRTLLVWGVGETRINGERWVLFETRDNPNLTADFGDGGDLLRTILCSFGNVVVNFGEGNDSLQNVFSTSSRSIIVGGPGVNRINPL